ncbi:MAG: hypothetical protein D6753_11100 [Planctomycetota bacterium]|nr:MAG: hypothetical protein D6753_11100 [Planctomycetota bacterium]
MANSLPLAAWTTLWEAGCRIGWWDVAQGADRWPGAIGQRAGSGGGILQRLLRLFPDTCTPSGRIQVEQIVASGYDLYPEFPRPWGRAISRLLGIRWFLVHADQTRTDAPLVAVVSSNLGRDHGRLPQWPVVLESALRQVHSEGGGLLLAKGTTLHDPAWAMAQFAPTPTVHLYAADAASQIGDWLRQLPDLLHQHRRMHSVNWPTAEATRNLLAISPPIASTAGAHPHATGNRRRRNKDSVPDRADIPSRDLATVALADRLLVVHARPGGRIARAVDLRLCEASFPVGSVYLYVPGGTDSAAVPTSVFDHWYRHGAVGWYVPVPPWRAPRLARCRLRNEAVRPAVHQIAARIPEAWSEEADRWDWLTHCTRGSLGAAHRDATALLANHWLAGRALERHPLLALHSICEQKRIVAGHRTVRGRNRCVSFSAVPLRRLLAGRRFQSHLGRWDWEPYGLIVRRDALHRLGARQVIYGDESTFRNLPPEQRPFFQPLGRNRQWQAEQEWRVLGDVDLRSLPADAIRLFVRTRAEAWALARMVAWPVLWYVDA